MSDLEKTISSLKEISDYFHECRGNASFGSKAEEHFWELQSAARDAVELLKEQGALLNKIYTELAEWGLDCACDDLVCDDGWCDEHCDTAGTKPECIERWFKCLLKKDGEVG